MRAHAAVMGASRAYVEAESGLGVSELDMLIELGNQPGMRMSDLAAKMVVSAANVTRVAQSLAAQGLLVKERSPQSEREVLARLTPKGQAMFEKYFPKVTTFMSRLMDERLTTAEQQKLVELLEKLEKPER
jgi:DNA-binding MarR family transcriptional regulator